MIYLNENDESYSDQDSGRKFNPSEVDFFIESYNEDIDYDE